MSERASGSQALAAPGGSRPMSPTPPPVARRAFSLRLLTNPVAGVAGALLAIIVVFSILAPDVFPTEQNARSILANSSGLIVLTMATTFVLIAGSIDLSIGSVVAFAEVCAGMAMKDMGGSSAGLGAVLVGLAVALVAGLVWGMINGWLIARLDLPALIVTLATLGAALGVAQLITGGDDVAEIPTGFITGFGNGEFLGLPTIALPALAIFLLTVWVLRRTRFGRHTYATGSDGDAASRAGVDVRRQLFRVHSLAGLLYGFTAFLNLALFGTSSVGGHNTDALKAVTAAALGGTSVFGGIGTALGSLLGVFIPISLETGLVIEGVQPYWQEVAVGVALLLAIYADKLRRTAEQRG
jgi:ribose transport system permease protein